MPLSYNKRFKTFSTEQEYDAYYAEIQAACDAGTLELLETVVCCITYGDPTTPDEYLPSHEPGDENIKFKYNENDDIRYIKFLNPSWTKHGAYLSEIDGGYKPVLTKVVYELPDIIDGQQLTQIDSDFFGRFYGSSLPAFNNKNVARMLYNIGDNLHPVTTLPSSWAALSYLTLTAPRQIAPRFVNNQVIVPNLSAIYVGIVSTGAGTPNYNNTNRGIDFPSLPKFISDAVTIFQINCTKNGEGIVNMDNVLSNCDNLVTLQLFNTNAYSSHSDFETKGYGVNQFLMTYNGTGLTIDTLFVRDQSGFIGSALNIMGTGPVYIDKFGFRGDLNTFDVSANAFLTEPGDDGYTTTSYVDFYGCSSSSQTTKILFGKVSHNSNKLSIDVFKEKHYIINCSFTTIELNYNVATSGINYLSLNSSGTLATNLDINVDYETAEYCNRVSLDSTTGVVSIPSLSINLDNQSEYGYIYYLLLRRISVSEFYAIGDPLRVANIDTIGATIQTTNKVSCCLVPFYENNNLSNVTITSDIFRFLNFTEGIGCITLTFDKSIPSAYFAFSPVKFYHISAKERRICDQLKLKINASATVSNLSLSFDSGITMYRTGTGASSVTLELNFDNATVDLSTVELILNQVEPVFSLTWQSGCTAKVTIRRTIYDQLSQTALDIFNLFDTRNIVEV